MAMKAVYTGAISAVAGALLERNVIVKLLPSLFKPSGVAGLPKAIGLTLGAVTISGFWLTMYGFSVGGARRKYLELAKKDGEEAAEERFSLPNLYVEGNTKNAKAFNCIQRSHQQAFETLPQFYAMTAAAALKYPVTAAAVVGMWWYGRIKWSTGYAKSEGDAGKRYDHPLAYLIFASVFAQFLLAVTASSQIVMA